MPISITPRGVAINTTGNGRGSRRDRLRRSTLFSNRVQRISPTGQFVSAWGWGVRNGTAEYQICTDGPNCLVGLSGAGSGQMNVPFGVAVDQATGDRLRRRQQPTDRRLLGDRHLRGRVRVGGCEWGRRAAVLHLDLLRPVRAEAEVASSQTVSRASRWARQATSTSPTRQPPGSVFHPNLTGAVVTSVDLPSRLRRQRRLQRSGQHRYRLRGLQRRCESDGRL